MKEGTIAIALLPPVPIVPRGDFTNFNLTQDQEDGLWRIIGPTVQVNLMRHGLGNLKHAFMACYWQGLENAVSTMDKSTARSPAP